MSEPYGSGTPPEYPGAYAQAENQYPQYPSYPPPPDEYGRATRGPAPASVVLAVRLMITRAGLDVVSLIVLFLTRDELKKRILRDTPNATDATVHAALTITAVIGVAVLIFYLFLALQVRRGKNWARIVTWVLAGLAILGAISGLTQPAPPLSRILGLLVAVLDIAIVVLLALGTSNRYFRSGRRA